MNSNLCQETVLTINRIPRKNEFLLISLLIVLVIPLISADQCESGKFGVQCQHECHCEDMTTCNNITGKCGTGCAQGWDGPTCQRQNIALHRPTRQSTTAFHGDSGQAVDGHTCPFYDISENKFSCTHTKVVSKIVPYWMVDLEGLPEIYYMKIFNRDDLEQKFSYRLLDFQVYVSNSTKYKDGQKCYDHDTTKFVSHKFNCVTPVRAKHVIVRLSSKKEPLSICEFQVFTCAPMWFGEMCDKECNCRNRSEVCDPIRGRCTTGCPEGSYGSSCQEGVIPEVTSADATTQNDISTTVSKMNNETSPQRLTDKNSERNTNSDHLITALAMLFVIAVVIIGFMSFFLAKRTQLLKRLPVVRL